MATQRRSERLRRKARQSTPGLSKPGAYTLYGSGYVVESEASFATSSQFRLPHDSRRARYAESPHCLQLETSEPIDEPRPRRASLLDAVRGALPDVLRRRAAQAYDAIAASPLARRRLRTQDEDETDEIVAESEDEDVDTSSQPRTTPADLLQAFFELPQAQRTRAYLFLLAALFAGALILLTALSSFAEPRSPRGFPSQERIASLRMPRVSIPRLPRISGLGALRLPKVSLSLPKISFPQFSLPSLPSIRLPSLPALPHLPPMPSLGLRRLYHGFAGLIHAILNKVYEAPIIFWSGFRRFAFGGAWRAGMRHISREEFQEQIYPAILKDVREIVRQESTSDAVFEAFRERYSADKGLPADFALASAGASVIAADPSPARQFARFMYAYAGALVRPASFVPAQPRRPSAALVPDVSPGMCWAFPGAQGSLTVRLARPVWPTAVTVEHTPAKSAFGVASAPKRFRIYMMPRAAPVAPSAPGDELILLGEFEFSNDADAGHVQTFEVDSQSVARAMKIEIVENHGAAHTCLYRFRVHGNAVEL